MRTKIPTLVVLLAALLTMPLVAAEDSTAASPTFHGDVEAILQHNCQGCHRPEGAAYGGMIAPMSLVTYQEVRPWAKSIARQVTDRSMPPWFASEHTKGQFSNERVLSEDEIATIVRWAGSGAAMGNADDAPPPAKWATHEGWSMGEPDLVINLAEPFWIDDDVRDINISLAAEELTREMLPEPRYVAITEFRPGSTAVHHIIGSARAAEAESPGTTGMIGGIAPGTEPMVLPAGTGRLLVPGTKIYFQMHYNKEPGEGSGRWDNSQIAFKFHPEDAQIERIAIWEPIGNRDFEIPPGHPNWQVGASKIFEHNATIYSLLPHMHLRGNYASYVAFYPDGTQELLLEVPEYDWNWQLNYDYIEPKFIPAGTRIEVTMTFKNTEERNAQVEMDLNTNRPVRFGGPTHEEMMLGFLDYAYHLPVEDLLVETSSTGGQ